MQALAFAYGFFILDTPTPPRSHWITYYVARIRNCHALLTRMPGPGCPGVGGFYLSLLYFWVLFVSQQKKYTVCKMALFIPKQ